MRAQAYSSTAASPALGVPAMTAERPRLPVYMTIAAACEAFSVSPVTWYRHASRGEIRMVKLGKRTLIEVQSILDHFDAHPARIQHARRAA